LDRRFDHEQSLYCFRFAAAHHQDIIALPEPTTRRAMAELPPEQPAREQIDAMLIASGWAVQNYKIFNPSAAPSIALREVPLKWGRCDYLLLVDRKASEDLEAALEQFATIAEDMKKARAAP
jgi:type I site-specific restriction endonuclease